MTEPIFKNGERVVLTADDRTIDATVILASENGASLALEFEAIVRGHVGMMPVLRGPAGYHDLMTRRPVEIAHKRHRAFLIDPVARKITPIETDAKPASLAALIEPAIGGLDSGRIAEHADRFDYAWVADQVLTLKRVHAFRFDNRDHPWGGKVVVIGNDRGTGYACDVGMSLSFLCEHVMWLGLIEPKVEWKKTDRGVAAVAAYRVIDPEST